jgi:hypothetical protein
MLWFMGGGSGTHRMTGGWEGHIGGLDAKERKILSLEYWPSTCSLAV